MGFKKNGSGNGNQPDNNPPKPAKMLRCGACGFECLTIADLQAHIAAAHPGSE